MYLRYTFDIPSMKVRKPFKIQEAQLTTVNYFLVEAILKRSILILFNKAELLQFRNGTGTSESL